MDTFRLALEKPPWPVTYNGDLFTRSDLEAFQAEYPQVDTVMLGRGLICNPWLMGCLLYTSGGGPAAGSGGDAQERQEPLPP